MGATRRTVLKMAWGAVTVLVIPVSALGWRSSDESEVSDGEAAAQSWSAGPAARCSFVTMWCATVSDGPRVLSMWTTPIRRTHLQAR